VSRRATGVVPRRGSTESQADTYDLDGAAQAHRDVTASGYVGKLVVTPCTADGTLGRCSLSVSAP
jgi:hypothetical protein